VRVSRLYGKNSIPSRGGNTFLKTLYNYAVRVDMLRDLRLADGTAKRSLLYAAARVEMLRYHENRDRILARARFADFHFGIALHPLTKKTRAPPVALHATLAREYRMSIAAWKMTIGRKSSTKRLGSSFGIFDESRIGIRIRLGTRRDAAARG